MPEGNYGGGPNSGYDLPAFRVKFGEFVSVTDDIVGSLLDDAVTVWLDPDKWVAKDYPLAVLYWVGHFLQLRQRQFGAGAGGAAGAGSPDIYISGTSFGERHVTFAQRNLGTKTAGVSDADALLTTTYYGRYFLLLRDRNITPVMSV